MATAQPTLATITAEAMTRVMEPFGKGDYALAFDRLKEEQKRIFRDNQEVVLEGIERLRIQPSTLRLFFQREPHAKSIPVESIDHLTIGGGPFYATVAFHNHGQPAPSKGQLKDDIARRLEGMRETFYQQQASNLRDLKAKLTEEGMHELIDEGKFNTQIDLNIDEEASTHTEDAFLEFRRVFRRLGETVINRCLHVVEGLRNYRQYKGNTGRFFDVIRSYRDDLRALSQSAESSPYLIFDLFHLNSRRLITFQVRFSDEKISEYFNGAYRQLGLARSDVLDNITRCTPNIEVRLKPLRSGSSSYAEYIIVVHNQCDTEHAAIKDCEISYTAIGVEGNTLGPQSVEVFPEEPKGYAYTSDVIEVPIVGPNRVLKIKVRAECSHKFLTSFPEEREFDISEFYGRGLIKGQQVKNPPN